MSQEQVLEVAERLRAEDPDGSMEVAISTLLRTGVTISLLLVVAGLVMTFFEHPDYLASTRALELIVRARPTPGSIAHVTEGLTRLRGWAVTDLGLVLLIATPVMRVALSAVGFAKGKNRRFVLITLGVLALLMISFFLGRAGA